MTYYISHIKDSIGNNFLGIVISKPNIDHFLNDLKLHLNDEYDDFITYKLNRDRGEYHLTLINVSEYNRLCKEIGMSDFVKSLDRVFKYEIDDLKMLGIGNANKNENSSYFIVCESDKLNSIRKRYNLPDYDFHITIGFKHKDVFGVRKNIILKLKSNFLKLLKDEFYKKENFNFIRNIKNFDLSKELDIIPIAISENSLTLLCGETIINIGILNTEGIDYFAITNQYKSESDEKRLPLTEIYKKLENIN